MAARAVLRDVVRVLGKPYGFGDRLAKAIPVYEDAVQPAAKEIGKALEKLKNTILYNNHNEI